VRVGRSGSLSALKRHFAIPGAVALFSCLIGKKACQIHCKLYSLKQLMRFVVSILLITYSNVLVLNANCCSRSVPKDCPKIQRDVVGSNRLER
jgi:hypothetical protein